MINFRCDRPPVGWQCDLPLNHPGPCPAYPAPIDPDWFWNRQITMARWGVERFERTLWNIEVADLNISSKELKARGTPKDMGGARVEVDDIQKAKLIASKRADGSHAITLDIDHPAELIPSSTEGHFHLYIDVPMEWWRYKLLLRVLAFCGVIEWGYARASIRKGASFLRLPWVKKPTPDVPF